MDRLHVSLLGRFRISCAGAPLPAFGAQKVQELLSYLLLYRERPHHREALATLLWPEATTAQSRQYFRKTLWQLQAALEKHPAAAALLVVEDEWVQVNSAADYWLDVAEITRVYSELRATPGAELPPRLVDALAGAVALYRGALFEGWYPDWCLNERERCQHMHLVMLDRLMDHCLLCGDYARGIDYGADILHCDLARERTYRQLMLLHALLGDRTGAIHQYERCVAVLHKELGVPPAASTVDLYRRICDATDLPAEEAPHPLHAAPDGSDHLRHTSHLLHRLEGALDELQRQVAVQRQAVERTLQARAGLALPPT